jgi:hypothetical protein
MAQSQSTSNSIVSAKISITELLAAPLDPNWTVEGLAEQVLSAIAIQHSEEAQEFILDAQATADRQARRLLRPLFACLATKSAAETSRPAELYWGHLTFMRPGPKGPVWIYGRLDNRPGNVRITLKRSNSPPDDSELRPRDPAVLTDAALQNDASRSSQPPLTAR